MYVSKKVAAKNARDAKDEKDGKDRKVDGRSNRKPSIANVKWSESERERFCELYKMHGSDW